MNDACKRIQQLGKGISCASRYEILQALMKGSRTVNELVEHVHLTQPAVSQHLATLKSCGLVTSIKQGQEVYYSIDTRYMLDVLKNFTTGISRCKETQHKKPALA